MTPVEEAAALLKDGRQTAADQILARAVFHDHDPEAARFYADLLLRRGHRSYAENIWREALSWTWPSAEAARGYRALANAGLARVAVAAGEFAIARERAEGTGEVLTALGEVTSGVEAFGVLSQALLGEGRLQEAGLVLRKAAAMVQGLPSAPPEARRVLGAVRADHARLLLREGRPEAEAEARAAADLLRGAGAEGDATLAELILADIAADRGDMETADRIYESLLPAVRTGDRPDYLPLRLVAHATVKLELGEAAAARALLLEALETERRLTDRPLMESQILFNLGLVAEAEEDWADAERQFTAAATLAERVGAGPAVAMIYDALARLRRRAGDRETAESYEAFGGRLRERSRFGSAARVEPEGFPLPGDLTPAKA